MDEPLFDLFLKQMSAGIRQDHAEEIDNRLGEVNEVSIALIDMSRQFAQFAMEESNPRYMDISMAMLAASGILPELFLDADSILRASEICWSAMGNRIAEVTDPEQFLQ